MGSSEPGSLLAYLLTSQGARLHVPDEDPQQLSLDPSDLPDVVIDAAVRTAAQPSPAAERVRTALRDSARGGIFCAFTAVPAGFPVEAPDSEHLIDAAIGLEPLPDEAAESDGELPVVAAYAAASAAVEITASLLSGRTSADLEIPLAATVFTLLGRELVQLSDASRRDEMAGPRFPLAEIYRCGDGRFVQLHGTSARFSDALCHALDHPEWVEAARAGMRSLPDYAAVERWRAEITKALGTRTAAEAEQAFAAHGGSCSICVTREGWRGSDQATASRVFEQPVQVLADPASVRTAAESAAVRTGSAAAPLAGIRVLDLSIVLAGPTCGRTLAEWGADVVKLDSPSRSVSPFSWIDVNRSKRSVLVDLKTEEGRQVLWRLLLTADVLLENFRLGKLAALGFDYDSVAAHRPGIIYASMNAFDYAGPMSARPGWEHNAEAASGMQAARAVAGTPQPVPYPVNDYLTGLLGAYGVLSALHQRQRTGLGALVRGSLVRTASFIQRGRFTSGAWPAAHRTLRVHCSDGVVRVELADRDDQAAVARLRKNAAQASCGAILRESRMVGLRAVRETDVRVLARAGALSPFMLEWEQSSAGHLRQPFTPHFGDFAGRCLPRWPAPEPGEHTDSVLRSLGYEDAQIEALKTAGAVKPRSLLFK